MKAISLRRSLAAVIALSTLCSTLPISPVHAAEPENSEHWNELQSILANISAKQTTELPKSQVVLDRMTQGMLLGNGSLGVVSDARENEQSYYMSTGDSWNAKQEKITNAQLKFTDTAPEGAGGDGETIIPTITATDDNPADKSAGPASVIDGKTDTFWITHSKYAKDGDRILTMVFPEAITVDMWRTTHRGFVDSGKTRYNTREFILEKSDNGTDWVAVDHVKDNTEQDVVRTLDEPVTAKYFRINVIHPVQPGQETHQNEGDRETARIGEVDFFYNNVSLIHGNTYKPDEGGDDDTDKEKASFAFSSSDTVGWNSSAGLAFDDNEYTAWKSDNQVPAADRYDQKEVPFEKWVQVSSAEEFSFDEVEIKHSGVRYPDEEIYNTYSYVLESSMDGKEWTTLETVEANLDNINVFQLDQPVSAKYLRLRTSQPVNPEYDSKYVEDDMTFARIVDINLLLDGKNIISEAQKTVDEGYLHEQDILNAEVRSKISIAESPLEFRAWTADQKNLLYTDVKLSDSATAPVTIYAELTAPDAYSRKIGSTDNVIWVTRDNGNTSSTGYTCRMVTATKVLSGTSEICGNSFKLTLQPGETAKLVTYVNTSSGYENGREDIQIKDLDVVKESTINYLKPLTQDNADQMWQEHLAWWKEYWLKSYVDLEDGLVEDYYYGALYTMGCTIRPTPEGAEQPNVPPTMAGLWQTTDKTMWSGKGYTNYNYEGPYYGMSSSNRGDYMIPYYEEAAVRVSRAQNTTASAGYEGAQIPRTIVPLFNFYDKVERKEPSSTQKPGSLPTDQKSNIMLYTMPLIWDWEYYRNDDRLIEYIYDAITETAKFYLDFVELNEDGTYWIYNSSNNESAAGTKKDTNAALDMGYIVSHMTAFIEMSQYLNRNLDLCEQMQNVLDNLAPMPTSENSPNAKERFEQYGVKFDNEILVSAYDTENDVQCEAGNCGWGDYIYEGNQPVILEGYVHPGGVINKHSDPELLELARNTFEVLNPTKVHYRGASYNGFCKSFTVGARLGVDPEELYHDFEVLLGNTLRMNLTANNGHGIETAGAMESVNSMLLQNEDSIMEVFPCWPKDQDAKFVTLRAKGAFLVSSEQKNGSVEYVEIQSEDGLPVNLINPWSSDEITVLDSHGNSVSYTKSTTEHTNEMLICFETTPGETYTISREENDDSNVTISSYTITVKQTDGGKITPSTTSVTKGSDKTFTITANEGYKIADVLVDGKSVGAVSTYTFKNVTAKHTITAKFEKDEAGTIDHFTDVKSGDWFYDAVEYVVENGLMNGVAEDKFAPQSDTTRGMIVTILYREAGSPEVESDGKTWWSDARVWAMDQGISDGTNMERSITREQLAAMLYRYAGSPAVTGEITGFSDVDAVSDWASDAMKWAVEEGILNGSNGKLNPQGNASRAQVAAMLMRFCQNEQ